MGLKGYGVMGLKGYWGVVLGTRVDIWGLPLMRDSFDLSYL